MPDVDSGVSLVLLVVNFAIIVVSIYAFVMSLTYSAEAYDAAGKWSKPGWTIVLGLGAFLSIIGLGISPLISIAFLIAALVFLADVKPALAGLRRR
ncbi:MULTISPECIES: DUF2516 family protein [Nocardioides]|uniref:DUF2516 domain-containing protein n=1 Tax=Nocardioides lianchengensis TaxID=1045774 RepID=A0A1G7AZ90_9ACTN|nr:DUF2516 family protein [Nocardioides lianchengensis]NYG13331.1 choline-glycine betaine transporter [Nocardioides lianchengensis]SDE19296.1 Protein of unknown function [Nocardioides lianchengensis]